LFQIITGAAMLPLFLLTPVSAQWPGSRRPFFQTG
jgi:hypothetical protein